MSRIRKAQCVRVPARTFVREHRDDLVAVKALAHSDRRTVRVDRVRLVAKVIAILRDGAGTDLIKLRNVIIEWLRCSWITRQPDRFPIVGHTTTREVLLLTFVNDRDTVCEDGERNGVFCERDIGGQRGEAGVVMVFEKRAEKRGVLARGFHRIDPVDQVRD